MFTLHNVVLTVLFITRTLLTVLYMRSQKLSIKSRSCILFVYTCCDMAIYLQSTDSLTLVDRLLSLILPHQLDLLKESQKIQEENLVISQ